MATVISTFVGTVNSVMPDEWRVFGNNGKRVVGGRFLWPGTTTTTCQPPNLGVGGSVSGVIIIPGVANTTAPYYTVNATTGDVVFTRQETATASEYYMEIKYSG